MDCDKLIDGMLSAQGTSEEAQQTCSGKTVATSYVQDQQDPDTQRVQKRPLRGETRCGYDEDSGSTALQLYGVASMFLPISAENQLMLIADDPFVGHALSSATCELYHRYGMLYR